MSDRLQYTTLVSVAGNLLIALSFMFLGPLPFLPLEPSVTLILVFMGVTSVGNAHIMVSTFARAQAAAIRMGFTKDIQTYLLISGTIEEKENG